MELEPHWWRLSKLLQVLSSVNNSGQADDVFRPLSLSLSRGSIFTGHRKAEVESKSKALSHTGRGCFGQIRAR